MKGVLWTLSLLVPLACVWGGALALHVMDDGALVADHISGEEKVIACALLAAPFVLLAVLWGGLPDGQWRTRKREFAVAATLGCLVAGGSWAVFYWGLYAAAQSSGNGGSPIILGILVMASPVMTWCGMWLALLALRRRPAG